MPLYFQTSLYFSSSALTKRAEKSKPILYIPDCGFINTTPSEAYKGRINQLKQPLV